MSAMRIVLLPRTAIAFRFLEPITAPRPVRPAMRPRSLAMSAKRTMRSPAGPMADTLYSSEPSSRRTASSVAKVSRPIR